MPKQQLAPVNAKNLTGQAHMYAFICTHGDKDCPAAICPFPSRDCRKVTADHWKKYLVSLRNEQDVNNDL